MKPPYTRTLLLNPNFQCDFLLLSFLFPFILQPIYNLYQVDFL